MCAFEDCKRKLTLTDYNCRCGQRFCGVHRIPEEHACTYDYKTESLTVLSTQLVKCVGDKGMTYI